MHKKLIKQMIKSGKTEDMEYLEDILDDLICDLKDTDAQWYKNIEFDMYKRVYGDHLNEELAKYWVSQMENKDGTKGQHWSMEQTNQFAENRNNCDFYAVLNMMYSDYYNEKFDTETYIALAKDWIDDDDAGVDKTLKYYMYIIRE